MNAPDLAVVFPPSPTNVPPGLTKASAAYTRHAWLALGGVLAFMALYLGLIGWLARTVWRLVAPALHGGEAVAAAFLAIPPLFFLAFLLRGLFVVRHPPDASLVEIDAKTQPTLFAFLHRLADETMAPRPHRVFVSARVNAGVFYDLSFWNLVFPSKKNLELGLGLVNVLSLDELKAVLAHEYGHFAQRSMAVGRWVYIAQQIAGQIVMARSVFDKVLSFLSNIDLRVAWIGWILRLFVWAIRAVLDTAFRLVVLAHRALGREMEFAADRVAVSVSGSDSLIHALHRLGPADQAWEEAVSFAVDELNAKRPVDDLFVLQTKVLGELRRILDEPDFGATPKRVGSGAANRVFEEGLAQPPRMWLTHPPSRDREENAKVLYLPSPLDERSAWALFSEPEALRRAVTEKLFVKKDGAPEEKPERQKLVSGDAGRDAFAKRYGRAALDPRYRGAYLARSIAARAKTPAELHDPPAPKSRDAVVAGLNALYPERLRGELKAFRERRDEVVQLEGLADGVLTAPGGVIRYRGREIRRKALRGLVDSVKAERDAAESVILEHDRAARTRHLEAAALVGKGWPEHLEALAALLHFTAHGQRDLGDAYGTLHHVLDIVLADGNVSSSERSRVRLAALDLFSVTAQVWKAKDALVLSDDVDAAFGAAGGFQVLNDELGLLTPTDENLGDWLRVMEGWVRGALHDLSVLGDVALDQLLDAEAQVAAWVREGGDVALAPTGLQVPASYPVRVAGSERPRQKRLGWWDRFQTADGFVPGALRATIASALLFPALFIGGSLGTPKVHVVNGLNVPVVVTMNGARHDLAPHGTARWDAEEQKATVTTTLEDGTPVETFEVDVPGGFVHLVYNVAQATALVEWFAVYGPGDSRPARPQGAPRWVEASQDFVFQEPPKSMSLKAGQSAERSVLAALPSRSAFDQLDAVSEASERSALVSAHLAFDTLDEDFDRWARVALDADDTKVLLRARIDRAPNDVYLQRWLLDEFGDAARLEACRRVESVPEKQADEEYLAARCASLRGERPDFVALWKRFPDSPWLAWAAVDGLVVNDDFARAGQALEFAAASNRFAPLKGAAVIERFRLWRLTSRLGKAGPAPRLVSDAAPGSAVQFVKRIERPARDEDPYVAVLQLLDAGNLAKASAQASTVSPKLAARLEVLVAASDGATAAQGAVELDVPSDLAWVRCALALRDGRACGDSGLEPEVMNELTPALTTRSFSDVERVASRHGLRVRGIVLAMGLVVFKETAPPAWRPQVKALLFPFERPFFRDAPGQ